MGNLRLEVLLADDEPGFRSALRAQLEAFADRKGITLRVQEAPSGADALCAMRGSVDLVVLDYDFKDGMDGQEVLERHVDPFGRSLIILASGSEEHGLSGAVSTGSKVTKQRTFAFLRKPLRDPEVLWLVDQAIHFIRERSLVEPLARVRGALAASQAPGLQQVTHVKDALETLTRFSTIVLLADAARNQRCRLPKLKLDWARGIGLGTWMGWLTTLLTALRPVSADCFAPEIFEIFDDRLKALLLRFKDEVRDPVLGHGTYVSDPWYREVAKDYRSQVEDSLAGLSRYVMVIPGNPHVKGPRQLAYEVRWLTGGEERPISLLEREPLVSSHVYLRSMSGRWLDLHPFAVSRLVGRSERPMLLSTLEGNAAIFDGDLSERMKDEQLGSELKDLLVVAEDVC